MVIAMQKTIKCLHCEQVVPVNPRLKGNQTYCNKKACQNARKLAWYQAKIASDPGYAQRQENCKQQWRTNKPANKYQNQYRHTHPEYVARNRQQQKQRNRNHRLSRNKQAPEKIVKIDALFSSCSSNEKSDIYQMKILTPEVTQQIVKIDTFLVQIQPRQWIEPTCDP